MYLDSSLDMNGILSVNPVSKTLAALHPEAVARFIMNKSAHGETVNAHTRPEGTHSKKRLSVWLNGFAALF